MSETLEAFGATLVSTTRWNKKLSNKLSVRSYYFLNIELMPLGIDVELQFSFGQIFHAKDRKVVRVLGVASPVTMTLLRHALHIAVTP